MSQVKTSVFCMIPTNSDSNTIKLKVRHKALVIITTFCTMIQFTDFKHYTFHDYPPFHSINRFKLDFV